MDERINTKYLSPLVTGIFSSYIYIYLDMASVLSLLSLHVAKKIIKAFQGLIVA